MSAKLFDNAVFDAVIFDDVTDTELFDFAVFDSVVFDVGAAPTTYVISDNTGASFSGTEDTFVRELSPTANNGTSGSFSVTFWTTGDRETALIKFTGLSSVLAGTVTNAKLRLYCNIVFGGGVVELYALSRAFNETQATWNEASTGTNWGAGGALNTTTDHNPTLLGSINVTTAGSYYEISGAGLDAYIQAVLGGAPDYGLILMFAGTVANATSPNDSVGFTSSEGTDGQRPEITFDWAAASAGGTVSQTFSVNYRVLNAANQAFNLSYRVLNAVNQTYDFNYRVFNAVSQPYDLSYRVFNTVSQIFDLSYGVINTGSVSQAFDMSYRVLNAVNQAFDVNYRVLNAANQTFDFNYRVFNASTQTHDISYRVFNAASQTYNFNYRVLNAISQPYDLSYRVFNTVSQIFDLSYGVINTGSVSQVFNMSYRVFNTANQAFDVNYRVLNAANQAFDASYRVFNAAAQSFDFNYRIFNTISQTQNYAWRVLNSAEYAFNISYKVGDFDFGQVPEFNNIGHLINKALLKNDLTPLPGLSVFGDAVLFDTELQPVQSSITLKPISPGITWQKLH